MGITTCFVFRHPLDQASGLDDSPPSLWCSVKANGFEAYQLGLHISKEFGLFETYHLSLIYYSYNFFDKEWKETLSQSDANGFSQIEVTFETNDPGWEVTKCGARLVYHEQDIEDLKQTKVGSSNCVITPYEDGFEDSAKDTKTKRRSDRDDSNGDMAGPSGEGTSNEVDVPHPKRIRVLPNIIERFIPRLENWIGNSSKQEQGDYDCKEEEEES